MALFGKLFYKKPPDGLLEISERVYVFDCCFTTDPWDQDNYKGYIVNIVSQLKDHYPDASILIFNFREGDTTSQLASALSDHDMTIVEYPRHYEGCPILSMEAIHHFLRSGESWLSFGMQNVLLMHCERGGWPVLAFMLAALLIYRKYYSGEAKTLDMVYKQAPSEVVHLFSSLNPLPSQLRYLQYVSRRNVATEWPPLDRALSLDCVIMRMIPDVDGKGGCRPIFRIYGQDPYMPGDKATKLLFSTPKWSKNVRYYKEAECEVVIIDINCHIQGDIVLECINYLLDDDEVEHENIMYRAMFNTSFIRSNILIVNRDEIDVLWDANFEFPKDFKAEFLFSEMDAAASIVPFDAYFFDETDTIPIEAFSKVQEMFSSVDWPAPTNDAAIDKGKKRTGSSENDPKSSGQLAKEKSFVSQEPLDASRRSVSSSTSTSPKNLSESEPVHPYLRRHQETHLHESTASSKNLATGVDKSPSAKSTQLLKETADNEVTTIQLEPLSQTRPPTQPAFPPSILPSPSLKGIDAKVEPSLTVPSQKSPSRSSREDRGPAAQTSRTPRRSQDSPPLSPPTPPLKEKLATGGEPTPPRTPTRPTSPSPEKSTDKPGPSPSPHSLAEIKNEMPAKIIGPSPSPPPPTETKKEKPSTTAATSPTPPVSPPHSTAPTKEKLERTVRPSPTPPASPPPPTAPTKEKPERTSGPSPMPPVSPPPSTAPTKEKPERTDGPSPMPPVSPPPSTAPTKEKLERTAGPSPMPPISPLPSTAPTKERPDMGTTQSYTPAPPPAPLPPPPPTISLKETPITKVAPPPPPPPTPPPAGPGKNNGVASPVPPPPPPIPSSSQNEKGGVVPPPPPPSRANSLPGAPAPPPPLGRGRGLSLAMKNQQGKKLKPLHWLKLTRAVQGSLWAETQKSGEAVKTPEIDIKELENLFSAANPNQDKGGAKSKSASVANKPEKVQLIEHRRACNCEIMLSKVKIPLSELMDYVLALDESALDVDQVDNLIKFCPTKEEIDLLKGYKGEKDKLGKCEQFFMELMKVPRTESKLRVFSFKLQFGLQVSDLRKSLNSVNSAVEEVRSSSKFKRVMQTILTLGNALNQGTARGSAVGFRLDSLLKLTDTRARNNKMTLMHYLCKVLSEKLPELLDFSKELESLEPASKVQLKYLAEEMQSISKGLEKVVQELSTAENDGPVSQKFIKALKEFLCSAEGEARALASLYSLVGKNVDALILYFGEDPARCAYEHVVSTLRNFVRMFNQAHEENCKKLEAEKKKAEKEASNELSKPSDSKIESENIKNSPVKTVK